jgi:hypothetical protein
LLTGYWIQRLKMHPRMRHQATTNTLAPSTCNHWWKEWDGGMGAGEPMAHFSEGRSRLMGDKPSAATAPLPCSADVAVAPFFSPRDATPFLYLAAVPFGILAAGPLFSRATAAPTDFVPQLPPAPLVSPFFVDGFQGCEGNLELWEIYGRKLAWMDGILPPRDHPKTSMPHGIQLRRRWGVQQCWRR